MGACDVRTRQVPISSLVIVVTLELCGYINIGIKSTEVCVVLISDDESGEL